MLSPIIYYVGFQIIYYFAIEKSNREAQEQGCEEEKKGYFIGIAIRIERYEYDDFMNQNFFSIGIKTQDSIYINYQFYLKENKDLLTFISIGDSIVKQSNEAKFLVIKKNKPRKTFVTPSCK